MRGAGPAQPARQSDGWATLLRKVNETADDDHASLRNLYARLKPLAAANARRQRDLVKVHARLAAGASAGARDGLQDEAVAAAALADLRLQARSRPSSRNMR